MRAGSNPPAPLQGGAGKIIRVADKTTVIKVTVTSDMVDANPDVMLTPPK